VKVDDLMTREVRACTIHESLNAAARIMWDHDCGCAPIVDKHGKLVGIVTDRDVCMAAYTQGVPLEKISVERAMSAKVVSCGRGDDLETAHRLMRTHEIHRLPVVDSRSRLLGILSLSDLVTHARRSDAEPSEAIEVATTLYLIHRRRPPVSTVASMSSNGGATPLHDSKKALKKTGPRRRNPSADRP
jgi:CBS domain-containing protein